MLIATNSNYVKVKASRRKEELLSRIELEFSE